MVANPSTIWAQLSLPNPASGAIPFVNTDNVTIATDVLNFYYNSLTHQLSVDTNGDYTGTDAVNTYFQQDSYLPASTIAGYVSSTGLAANLSGNTPGHTTSSSQGTGLVPLPSLAGDFLGQFSSWGYATVGAVNQYYPFTSIYTTVAGSSAGDLGGVLHFATKGDGGTLVDAMTISQAGVVSITGTLNPNIANLIVGTGNGTGAPGTGSIQGSSAVGANIAGGNVVFASGQGTGSANGGFFQFEVSPAGAAGSTANPLVVAGTISAAGHWNLGGGSQTTAGFQVIYNGSYVDRLVVTGGTTGSSAVTLSASGTDTNININLTPQAAGWVYTLNGSSLGRFSIGGPMSAWSATSDIDVFELGSNVAAVSSGNLGQIVFNQYFNGTNWLYKNISSSLAGGLFFNTTSATFSLSIAGTSGNVVTNISALRWDGFGSNIILGSLADQNKSVQVPTTGFSITIGSGPPVVNKLILDPAGTLASGTITMPASPVDGQVIEITSSATITALTVSANAGQSIKNAPTTLVVSATGPQGYSFIYHTANTTWYRLR